MCDITILIQGPLNKISIDHIKNYNKYGNVVLSYFSEERFSSLKENLFLNDNILEVESFDLESIPFLPDYRLHQLLTTSRGLDAIKSKYTIKTRSDENWPDLDLFIDTFLKNDEKILTSNIFWKPNRDYHISDHLMMFKTDYLKKGLNQYLDSLYLSQNNTYDGKYIAANSCESHFGRSYLIGKYNTNLKELPLSTEAFKNDFECFDINLMKNYHVSYNGGPQKSQNKTYNKNNKNNRYDPKYD